MMAATSGMGKTIRVPAVSEAPTGNVSGDTAYAETTATSHDEVGFGSWTPPQQLRAGHDGDKEKGTSLAAASPFLSANQHFGQSRHLSLFSAVSVHSLESLVEQACCRYHASGDRNLGKANIRQETSYSVVVCR